MTHLYVCVLLSKYKILLGHQVSSLTIQGPEYNVIRAQCEGVLLTDDAGELAFVFVVACTCVLGTLLIRYTVGVSIEIHCLYQVSQFNEFTLVSFKLWCDELPWLGHRKGRFAHTHTYTTFAL